MRTKKWKLWELSCFKWHFNWYLWDMFAVLDMIILNVIQKAMCLCWVWIIFLIPLLKSCLCSQLRYVLTSMSHKLLRPAVTQFSLTWKGKLVAFKPSTTSLPCPGDPEPQSIMMLCACSNIDNKYSAVTQRYCSSQPSIFSHIVIVSENNTVIFCNS